MAVHGVVREWHGDDGWGVVDSSHTPGGCWVHFARLAMRGYATPEPGQDVTLEWERVDHDGFAFQAVRVWPADDGPVERVQEPPGSAYRSSLTITFDDGVAPLVVGPSVDARRARRGR